MLVKIVSGEKMGELDRISMTDYGIPGLVLMENAGLQVVNAIQDICPAQGKRIVILCGKGNNGGDGFVIGRHLKKLGYRVYIYAMDDVSAYKGDAAVNYNILLQRGLSVFQVSEEDPAELLNDLTGDEIIVDALLGTGITREVKEPFATLIKEINKSAAGVISVDIPSGISSDTGKIMGVAVESDYTVTFALPKRGLLLYPGASNAGKLIIADIGIPPELTVSGKIKENLLTGRYVASLLPSRIPDGNKGTYGRSLILAGSPGMCGAAAMAGETALRGGAGLVYVGTALELRPVLDSMSKEVIVWGFAGDGEGNLSAQGVNEILEKASACNSIALGPGLKPGEDTLNLLKGVITHFSVPVVIDAGGLGAMSLEPRFLPRQGAPLILTPHPGEMARLLGISPSEVQENRWEIASQYAIKWNVVLVLKGAHTVVASPEGEVFVNPTGNPVLSTAGTGDLLTGLITAFAAQGLSPLDAALCGVYLHGLAADLLVQEKGERGYIAGDITEYIPAAFQKVTAEYDF